MSRVGESLSDGFECRLTVTLRSDTPVVGIEMNPYALVEELHSLAAPQRVLSFTWYRKQSSFSFGQCGVGCSVHPDKLATVQCESCLKLNLPVEDSYHCSTVCFANEWINHRVSHRLAAEAVSTINKKSFPSCKSWPENEPIRKLESEWIEVGHLKSYRPSLDDLSSCLRLESVVVDPLSGAQLSSRNIIDTKPVIMAPICQPRRMIECSSSGSNFEAMDHSDNDFPFSVLSYNILADLYASIGYIRYRFCPTWARVWEYRREKLLHEILGYDADIMCLQEVQSDHFEDFFEPELTKYGYSVLYKKKGKQLYTANKFVSDGCATFYRRKLFKEISKHELEFDKMALSYIQASGQDVKSSCRLSKENVALVVVLETLENESYKYSKLVRTIICVANTHISANSELPDVKLFQVVRLVKELEEIVHSGIPLLICGDFNSVPSSDPYRFMVTGRCNPDYNKQQDPLGIVNHLNLHHSLHLSSAYASYPASVDDEGWSRKINTDTNEPIFTYMTAKASKTLDYIFYTENNLRVEALLDLLDCENHSPGLPSPDWPSDHIALMARFRLLRQPPSLGQSSASVPIRLHPYSELHAAKQRQMQLHRFNDKDKDDEG